MKYYQLKILDYVVYEEIKIKPKKVLKNTEQVGIDQFRDFFMQPQISVVMKIEMEEKENGKQGK